MPFMILRYREVMKKLIDIDSLEECLSQIVRDMETEFEFQSLGIFLRNESSKTFRLKISRNLSHAYQKRTEYQLHHAVVRRLEHGEIIQSTNPADIPYEKEYAHLVALPLLYRKELLGFLFVDHAQRTFTEEEIAKFDMFAGLTSMLLQLHRQEHLIESLTCYDAITGLYTYRHFHERALVAFQQARRYQHPLNLVVLKIGKYKDLYRTLGAAEAGSLIGRIAISLRDNLRLMEVIGLIYPDTVAILMPDSREEDVESVVERLQNTVMELSEHMKDSLLGWGIVSLSPELGDVDDMIRLAEEASFEATRRKNRNILRLPEAVED